MDPFSFGGLCSGARPRQTLLPLLWLAAFILGCGCTRKEPALGQLMVTILTDAPLPDYVDGIRLQAFQEADGESLLIFDREPEVAVGAGQLLIPTTLAIVTNGRPNDRVRLRLSAKKNGASRVLREAITQIPQDRIAELHLLIEWLCDGSAVVGDAVSCGDPESTCAGGRCIPKWIDPATLPTYQGPAGSGGGTCFDVPACFAEAWALPLTKEGCSVPAPNVPLDRLNLALAVVPQSGGQCLRGGNCLVSLSRGPLGWDTSSDGTRLLLPAAVCTTRSASVLAVMATNKCATKRPVDAICGAWSPFVPAPGTDGGGLADGGQGARDGGASEPPSGTLACTADDQCPTGHCAQGLCCATACEGGCRSCAVPGSEGTCSNLLPGTVARNGICAVSTCGFDGTCDGMGGCRLWAAGTSCGPDSCSAADQANASLCDGSGMCRSTAVNCAPYRCAQGSGCRKVCSSSADCLAGFYCDGAKTCVKKQEMGQPCALPDSCVSGFCSDGVCCGSLCGGTCETCAAPDAVGSCSAEAFGDGPSGDCAGTATCNGLRACVSGPVGKLVFENGAGLAVPSAPGSIGTGTILGFASSEPTVGLYVPGVRGTALNLQGTKYVYFASSPALAGLAINKQFTLSAFVRVPAVSGGESWILSRGRTGSDAHFGLYIRDGALWARVANLDCPTSSSLEPQTWKHFAATYNGNILSVFIDGARGTQCGGAVRQIVDDGSALIVGASEGAGGLSGFLQGDVDQFYLFNVALSAPEVQRLWMAR